MFCEIDGVRVPDLDLAKLKKEFPDYAHLLDKPMRFMLHPSLFKVDPDNPNKLMVTRRYGVKTRFSYNDDKEQAHTFQYYESSQPDKKLVGVTKKLPKTVFLEHGELVIDIRKGGLQVNVAKVYFLMSHPWFNNIYYLEDNRAAANKKLVADKQSFEAMKILFDEKDEKYIMDRDLESAARQLGINGVQGLEPAVIRQMLVNQAQTNPVKFAEFRGTKSSAIMAIITEAIDYKVLVYQVQKKTWYLTNFVECEKPMAVREYGDVVMVATNAKEAPAELVKFLIEQDVNNILNVVEEKLAAEKVRTDEIASEYNIEIEDVLTSISIQKGIPKFELNS